MGTSLRRSFSVDKDHWRSDAKEEFAKTQQGEGERHRSRLQNGYNADAETMPCGPRWTVSRSAFHKNDTESTHDYLANTRFKKGGMGRDTWVTVHARKNLNPGPGKYNTDSEMPLNKLEGTDWVWSAKQNVERNDGNHEVEVDEKKVVRDKYGQWTRSTSFKHYKDEFNANTTRKERAPKYTFNRSEREVSLPPSYGERGGQPREASVETTKLDGSAAWSKNCKTGRPKLTCLKPSYMNVPIGWKRDDDHNSHSLRRRMVQTVDGPKRDLTYFSIGHLKSKAPFDAHATMGDTVCTHVMETPGPGEYQQLTSFGAASGGARRHYFKDEPKEFYGKQFNSSTKERLAAAQATI